MKIAALGIVYNLGNGDELVTLDLTAESCCVETKDGLAYIHGLESCDLPAEIAQEVTRLLTIGNSYIDNPPAMMHLRGAYIGPGPGPCHYYKPLGGQVWSITIYLVSPFPH